MNNDAWANLLKLDSLLERVIDNRGKNPTFSNSGYPYIDTTCIVGENRYPEYSLIRKYVDDETYRNWFRSGHPQKDDLLIATVGANIGKICMMESTLACIAQNTIGMRADRKKSDPFFIYYLLNSKQYQQNLKSLDIASAQPSIKVPHLLSIELNLPPYQYRPVLALSFLRWTTRSKLTARSAVHLRQLRLRYSGNGLWNSDSPVQRMKWSKVNWE
jgi:type I restriction enzyme, S subunit